MSLRGFLNHLLSHLDAALASSGERAWIRRVAGDLPGSGYGGFECRLAPGVEPVDVQVNLPPGVPDLPDRFLRHPEWRDLQAFFRRWSDPDAPLRRGVRDVWLEVDQAGASEVPIPSFFLHLRDPPRAASDLTGLLPDFLRSLLRPPVRRRLDRCLEALPTNGAVRHVGFMVGRDHGLRVNVEGLAGDELAGFLDAAGWAGAASVLDGAAGALVGRAGRVVLALDVAGSVGDRIGLECSPARDDPRPWRITEAMIRLLVEEGLCEEAKGEAVIRWPGLAWKATSEGTWPPELAAGDAFMASRAESVVRRFVNHLKLSVGGARRAEAKAYLAYRHLWLSRDALREALAKASGS